MHKYLFDDVDDVMMKHHLFAFFQNTFFSRNKSWKIFEILLRFLRLLCYLRCFLERIELSTKLAGEIEIE